MDTMRAANKPIAQLGPGAAPAATIFVQQPDTTETSSPAFANTHHQGRPEWWAAFDLR
jgi:hypothetical protein